MTFSLEMLQANLVELDAWARTSSSETSVDDLIPNKDGTRLYLKSHFMGRIWKFYWNVVEYVTKVDEVESLRKNTLEKVVKTFKEIHQGAIEDDGVFLKQLIDGPERAKLSYEDRVDLKMRIFNYYYLIRPFWALSKVQLPEKVNAVIGSIFEGLDKTKKLLSQRFVIVESLTGQMFPLQVMQKLATSERLTRLDRVTLSSYIDRLKVPKKRFFFVEDEEPEKYVVKVRFFHKLLNGLIQYVDQHEPTISLNLVALETKLREEGLRIFQQEDPEYMRWRNSLKGKKFKIGDQEYTVGDKFGAKLVGKDNYLHYEIEGKPSVLLRTGTNEAILGIEYMVIKVTQYAIKYINFIHIDPKGRFVIIEKVVNTLEEIAQTYLKKPRNLRILYPLMDIVACLNQLNSSPERLPIKEIGFTNLGQLRTYRWLKETSRNPVLIEDFVNQCSLGNALMRSLLIRGAGMQVTAAMKFYDSVMENTLNNSCLAIFRARVRHFEFDSELNEKGQEFAKRVTLAKRDIKNQLTEKYIIIDLEKLDRMINFCIKSYHREYCMGSYIGADIVEKVSEDVVESLELAKKPTVISIQ